MDPVLNSYFSKFKQTFEIVTATGTAEEQKRKEADAFERFVNYVLFSLDYPDVFIANADLLDSICVGGGNDTGIDGIGIKVNDRLVRNIEEVQTIADASKKINVEFMFIQSKMGSSFDNAEFNKFGLGVKNFFSQGQLPESTQITELREIKDFIYSDEKTISKLDTNPVLYLYYVTTGSEPTDATFRGTRTILENDLTRTTAYFENVHVRAVGGKELIKACRELENKFEVQMNIIDIFPLIVDPKLADIKKAYAFTCSASELLKLLKKDDGSLRRSLFNDNVRDYLGRTPVNVEIEETISANPEMFLLCNNGITIVCSDFDQVRDKLVKIENPQVVNGCQTSTSVFNLRDEPNIEKVQLLIRVISTENLGISNKIVRGTNKQNQVLDEAFEATLPFHQEVLEPFFLAIDTPLRIYYERRSKQYNNDPLIKKTQIVNLRILSQTFVSMFLNAPHKGHIHEAKLIEEYARDKQTRKIFHDSHSPHPYYVCALTYYMFEKYFKEKKIDYQYRTYKAHLYLIFRYSLGEHVPQLVKSNGLEEYCKKLVNLLTEPNFERQAKTTVDFFEETQRVWLAQRKSRFGIKDTKEFTDLLLERARSRFIKQGSPFDQQEKTKLQEGRILNVVRRLDGTWFGFIEGGSYDQNIYFDNRGYKGDNSKLNPHSKVRYETGKRAQGNFAVTVKLAD